MTFLPGESDLIRTIGSQGQWFLVGLPPLRQVMATISLPANKKRILAFSNHSRRIDDEVGKGRSAVSKFQSAKKCNNRRRRVSLSKKLRNLKLSISAIVSSREAVRESYASIDKLSTCTTNRLERLCWRLVVSLIVVIYQHAILDSWKILPYCPSLHARR